MDLVEAQKSLEEAAGEKLELQTALDEAIRAMKQAEEADGKAAEVQLSKATDFA